MPPRRALPMVVPDRIDRVDFYDDRLVAVLVENGELVLPLVSVCRAMGLDEDFQVERLRTHDVLQRALRRVRVPIDGQLRTVIGIERSHVAFWLATITPELVGEAVRPKLVRYQTELVTLLDTVYGGHDLSTATTSTIVPAGLAPLVERVTALAMAFEAANQQLRMELQRLSTALSETAGAHDVRLAALETVVNTQLTIMQGQLEATHGQLQETQERLLDTVKITAAQAAVIQGSIQRIGKRYEQKTGKRIYDRLYSELHLELGAPKYTDLPAAKYEDALTFLKQKAREWLPDDEDVLPGLQERLL